MEFMDIINMNLHNYKNILFLYEISRVYLYRHHLRIYAEFHIFFTRGGGGGGGVSRQLMKHQPPWGLSSNDKNTIICANEMQF